MAGKKIWAYAIDNRTNQYVVGTRHKHRLYYIWEAHQLEKEDPAAFRHHQFMSTQRLESDRRPMHSHAGGFFRYNPNQAPRGPSDKDSDSLSHSLAIAALAELDSLNFICGKDKFVISPTSVETEQRLQLISQGKYQFYVPDLVLTFDHDSYWAKRWGNKLVIEVMHTHECGSAKSQDFENHGIPIIEVRLNSMTLENHAGTKTPNIQQIESFYDYIKRVFSQRIYGTILSNPVTVGFYQDTVTTSFERQLLAEKERDYAVNEVKGLDSLKQEFLTLKSASSEIEKIAVAKINELNNDAKQAAEKTNQLQQNLTDAEKKLTQLQQKLRITESEFQAEKDKGWLDRLLRK